METMNCGFEVESTQSFTDKQPGSYLRKAKDDNKPNPASQLAPDIYTPVLSVMVYDACSTLACWRGRAHVIADLGQRH